MATNHIFRDRSEFNSVFNKHYEELCRYAFKFIRDTAICEDIVQELFFQLWVNRRKTNVKQGIRGYLYTSVKNRCIDHIRKTSRFDFEIYEERVADQIETIDTDIDTTEIVTKVREAIENLPDKCKTIFCFSKDLRMSHNEIADELGISKKTIENQITIAIKKIREHLKKDGVISITVICAIIDAFK